MDKLKKIKIFFIKNYYEKKLRNFTDKVLFFSCIVLFFKLLISFIWIVALFANLIRYGYDKTIIPPSDLKTEIIIGIIICSLILYVYNFVKKNKNKILNNLSLNDVKKNNGDLFLYECFKSKDINFILENRKLLKEKFEDKDKIKKLLYFHLKESNMDFVLKNKAEIEELSEDSESIFIHYSALISM